MATNISFTSMVSGYNDRIVSGTSQLVSGLAAGPVYYYRVRAVGAGGTSINSNTITVNLGVQPGFTCGEEISFQYRGSSVTYGTLQAGHLCWMDRNLGAFRMAEHQDDDMAFGDLFQWGREDDGHQLRTSITTSVTSGTDKPMHDRFIAPIFFSEPYDWRIPQNDDLWQDIQGANNPCPPDWRLPTRDEMELIIHDPSLQGTFTYSGFRTRHGTVQVPSEPNQAGRYWSSTVSGEQAYGFVISLLDNYHSTFHRVEGLSVRCVRE